MELNATDVLNKLQDDYLEESKVKDKKLAVLEVQIAMMQQQLQEKDNKIIELENTIAGLKTKKKEFTKTK